MRALRYTGAPRHAPAALQRLFDGANLGKQLVTVNAAETKVD